MTKKDNIFDGKEKRIFVTAEDKDKVIIHYKDVATAFGNIKRSIVKGKGELNCDICALLFAHLNDNGVKTHFIKNMGKGEQLCHRISLIPIEFVVRNYAAGSMAARLGVEPGTKLANPVLDLGYNCDELGDPMMNEDEATALGIVSTDELKHIREVAMKVNILLTELFHKAGIKLVDFKMEFGRASDGSVIVSDEISPDTCRLWDETTGEILDKDRFRHDIGDILPAYGEVRDRLLSIKN